MGGGTRRTRGYCRPIPIGGGGGWWPTLHHIYIYIYPPLQTKMAIAETVLTCSIGAWVLPSHIGHEPPRRESRICRRRRQWSDQRASLSRSIGRSGRIPKHPGDTFWYTGFFKDIIVTTMGISLKGRIPKHPQLPMQLVVESIHVHDQ